VQGPQSSSGGLIDTKFKVVDDGIKDRRWGSVHLKHVACYVVTEEVPEWMPADIPRAHYVCVDIIYKDNIREPIFVCKINKGLEHAYAVAARCAKELGV